MNETDEVKCYKCGERQNILLIDKQDNKYDNQSFYIYLCETCKEMLMIIGEYEENSYEK